MCQTDYSSQCTALKHFFKLYQHEHTIQALKLQLDRANTPEELVNLYNNAITQIEKAIWQKEISDSTLKLYQQLFHEIEFFISLNTDDFRYQFIIAIPVADRPEHLNACLKSLLKLCKAYNYGGLKQGKYSKIRVLISDDSKHEANININKNMSELFTQQGLRVIYFGQNEQKQAIGKISNKLSNIIGDIPADEFYHKGASITRNITYLKLKELSNNDKNTLFYFIDSDQEFQINLQSRDDNKNSYAINYFYHLNNIFSSRNISILTGKVVGDPPVSPSVMAGNLLEDLALFISQMSKLKPDQSCQFHQQNKNRPDDASYHDMADLFGFKPSTESYQYSCKIKEPHNHIKCFTDFTAKLNQFFDGAHPTRKSYYEHEDLFNSIKPARTIYTGNYILNQQSLKYFIPFANLKLRMAGPTLGRIIKASIGDQFVSANLPMLHNRTVDSIGQSEFRPGVNHADIDNKKNTVDLSGEFIRQFFGDVMLFSIQELTAMGYPQLNISSDTITKTVKEVISSMQEKYSIKHNEINIKTETLKSLLNSPESWWNQLQNMKYTRQSFIRFINNIEFNFGENSPAYKFINSDLNINRYQEKIITAISEYSDDALNWHDTLNKNSIK